MKSIYRKADAFLLPTFRKDGDGNLIIDPDQAEIVRRIYREYPEGSCMDKIASGLEADGILTGAWENKMVYPHHQQDSPERKVYRRCASAKDLCPCAA